MAIIMGTIRGILLAIGMCMCLLPEWNAFTPGLVMGCTGLAVLLAMVSVWRKMENKTPIQLTKKTIFTVLLGIAGTLLFGVDMCHAMVWENMILGIIIGIVVLLSLLPMVKGLQVTMAIIMEVRMNKLMESQKKLESTVVSGHKKIEDGVVNSYKKIENGVVSGYKKIENKFVETFLTPDNDTERGNDFSKEIE